VKRVGEAFLTYSLFIHFSLLQDIYRVEARNLSK
jgi:hypothetical protein